MIPNEEYIEFDLKALFFYMLRQWKIAVIFGLVFALALGAFQAKQEVARQATSDAMAVYEKEYEHYVTKLERVTAQQTYTQKSVNDFQEYIDNSTLMKIDHKNVNTASATYFVDNPYPFLPEEQTQDINATNTLVWHYSNCLQKYATFQEIGAAVDMDPRYIPELVTVATPNEYSIVISVIHTSQETAAEILDILQEKLEGIHLELKESLGDHTLTQTAENVSVSIDTNLHMRQMDTHNHLTNLKVNLSVFNYDLRELEVPQLPVMPSISGIFVKWTILGGVIGVVVAFALVFLASILRNRLHASSQLVSAFHATVLGEAVCSRAKLPFLSRKFNALEGCLQENSEANNRLLAENIRHYCQNAENLLICSDTDIALSDALARDLNSHLEGIRLTPCANPLKDAEALKAISGCDAVVMVSSRDRSGIGSIRKILEQIRSYEKDVIGFIMTY